MSIERIVTGEAVAPARPARLARSTPKSAETRARIVEGALRALEHHGIGEATTRRIAAAAGVRLATLHYHFDSKDAVLLAVLDALTLELTHALAATPDAGRTLDGRIGDLIRAAWTYAEQTRAKQIVQYELTLYALRRKGQDWLAARQYEAYVSAYAAALGGAAEPDLGAAALSHLARFILAGIDGLILQALAGTAEAQLRSGLTALRQGAQARAATLRERLGPAGRPARAGLYS